MKQGRTDAEDDQRSVADLDTYRKALVSGLLNAMVPNGQVSEVGDGIREFGDVVCYLIIILAKAGGRRSGRR